MAALFDKGLVAMAKLNRRGFFTWVPFPFLFSLTGLILSLLVVLAGKSPDFMEDYAILRLNISNTGQNIVTNLIETGALDELVGDTADHIDEIFPGAGDFIEDFWDGGGDDFIEGILGGANDIANEAIEAITDAMRLPDWYSIHILTICEGFYTDDSGGYNVTNCTTPDPQAFLNLTELIDYQLSIAGMGFDLSAIDWPDEVDQDIKEVNYMFYIAFVFFALSASFSGVCVLVALVDMAVLVIYVLQRKRSKDDKPPPSRLGHWIALAGALAGALATIVAFVGAVVTSTGTVAGVDEINSSGQVLNVNTAWNGNFLSLQWVGWLFTFLCALNWIYLLYQRRKERRSLKKADPGIMAMLWKKQKEKAEGRHTQAEKDFRHAEKKREEAIKHLAVANTEVASAESQARQAGGP